MNFGNGNGNASNFSMPNMNMGNGNGTGSNFKMPNMNWGNGNGTGSNFSMPNMNWGNGNKGGNNWGMPSFNSGANNAPRKWAPRQNYNNFVQPQRASQPQRTTQASRPVQAKAPQIKPTATTDNSGFPPASINQAATLKTRPQAQASKPVIIKIPRPAEVKGVYLAPENRKNKILVRFNQY